MAVSERKPARDFWIRLKGHVRNESNARGFTFKLLSRDEIDVETSNGQALSVRFTLTDDRPKLNYELEDGTLKELQFVLAEKPCFRYKEVNYSPEALASKMFKELLASR